MRLRSLRLFGFKTFAEQTTLLFEPGITGIVGPNGSGKSNVVDAIRWVLGEQSAKSLRSTKIEDVIFAGNDRRRPLGMTEVTLTFANDDGAMKVDAIEVQITRRAYRAGESGEYFINRQQVRLRDVVDVLMGTGLGPGSYAIVSQGEIDAILSARPTERRGLFEETAGVNRFIARKNESLRRLERTEQNAIRLNDLLAEIAARIPELETQERRAKRYRRVSARVRDLEILSYLRASASRREERDRLAVDGERLDVARVAAAARAATADAEGGALRGRAIAHEQRLERLRDDAIRGRARDLAEARVADRRERAGVAPRRSNDSRWRSSTTESAPSTERSRCARRSPSSKLRSRPWRGELEDERGGGTRGARRRGRRLRAEAWTGVYAELRDVASAAAAARRRRGATARAVCAPSSTERDRLEAESCAVFAARSSSADEPRASGRARAGGGGRLQR